MATPAESLRSVENPTAPGAEWKNLKLSLERPYKDDAGQRIAGLFDIEPDGTYVYEPKETADERLKANLHRIFQERGLDFFERPEKRATQGRKVEEDASEDEEDDNRANDEGRPTPMTFEELNAMRSELLPQLYVALGEMTQARDILNSLLSAPQTNQYSNESPIPALSATVVSKLPPILSLQAFNSQITIGSKDEALRKAADLFNSVAGRMDRTHNRSEQYWINALKIRRNNWRMIPSPLPSGSFMGKGADRTAKDFLVLYGLEESSPSTRRRGLAHLSDINDDSRLVFSQRQHMRMRISLTHEDPDGNRCTMSNSPVNFDLESLDGILKEAQLELVDEEIFASLIAEASKLPTALARVSERLIVMDASQGVELKFELVKEPPTPDVASPICDLIYHALHVLLLRRHAHIKSERLSASRSFPTGPAGSPSLLQPIIDLLQYKVFCERLQKELSRASQGLNAVGIPTSVSFDAVGETGQEIISMLSEPRQRHTTSGEAVLKINDRHMLRLTFAAPSNLFAHLTQATLQVYSLPQLSQLLMTEIEQFILQRIRHFGEKLRGGTWFIDLDHLVARWENFIFTFHISFTSDMKINCSVFKSDSKTGRRGNTFQYSELNSEPLLSWVQSLIQQNS